MSNPSWHTNLLLLFPNLLINTLTLLFLRYTGLGLFLEPNQAQPNQSLQSTLLRELLPISEFSGPPENCAVCLYEFSKGAHIRRLPNCRHIFHRSCVDRWMDHNQWTCPLCRSRLVPEDFFDDVFNERLWIDTGVLDFCREY